jgi:hypothetical protein
MLKVTLHHATPGRETAQNVLGRLDIGYAKLDAHADYKLVMTARGIGEMPPARLEAYPRWAAGVWDLVARSICVCLHGREDIAGAAMPGAAGAFIENMTAVIEHWPDGLDMRRATVGTAHVKMRRRRCHYTATFEDDILGRRESSIFNHGPEGLTPWDLLVRAYAWTVHERFELPPRPTLYTPLPVEQAGQSLVCLETVAEPAATGIKRWLEKIGRKAMNVDFLQGPCVTEATFVEFLRKAV